MRTARPTPIFVSARAEMVNVPSFELPEMLRIAPGDPTRSYLCLKAFAAISAEEGAQTLTYLAQSSEIAGRSGGYYVHCALAHPGVHARSDVDALRLWELSAQLTGVDFRPATASA